LFAPTSKSNTHVQHTLNMLGISIISLHISGHTCQSSNVVPLKLQLDLDLQFSYNLAQSCDDIQGACYTNVWRLGKAGYCQANKHGSSASRQELTKKIPEDMGTHRIYVEPYGEKTKQQVHSMLLVRAVPYYLTLKDSPQMRVYKNTK